MTDGVPTPRELLLSGVSKCNGSTIVKVMIQRMFCRLWVCLLLLGPGVSMAEDPAAGLRERDGTAADWPQYLNSGNWLLVEVWDPDCPICNASVAEVIELDRQRTGSARAGIFFAIWQVATKASIAISSGFALIVLDVAGFVSRAANTESALLVLTALYAGVPIVLKLSAVAMMWRFPLDRRALDRTFKADAYANPAS